MSRAPTSFDNQVFRDPSVKNQGVGGAPEVWRVAFQGRILPTEWNSRGAAAAQLDLLERRTKTTLLYALKYYINGALFRLTYTERAARDSRADVLASNGVVVTCGTKRVPNHD